MRFAKVTLALAIAALAAAPAWAATKIVVGYTPSIDVAPVFSGIEHGIFAKHGLEVEVQAGNGTIMIAGVSSGSMQIGNPTATTLLQAVDSGLDMVIVSGGNFMDPNVKQFATVVRNGLTITKPQDYVGKKVGVSTIGAFVHAVFLEWLTKNGVDPKKVSFVEVPFPQHNDVLKQGNVDAVISIQPFVGRMIEANTGTASYDFVQSVPPGLPVVVYVAQRAWVAANEKTVRAFRAAMAESIEFVRKNPDKMRVDAAKYLKIPMPILQKLHEPDLRVDIDPKGIAEWIKIMKGQGLIKADLDANKLIFR